MQHIVSPLAPFPNIYWWGVAQQHGVVFDVAEQFVKMSYRNRYYITGANGLILLTVPVVGGRNQRTAMQEVLIDNSENWQVQHWRTLVSVYNRAPYFEHFAPTLEQLYQTKYDKLVAFNEASVHWLQREANIKLHTEQTAIYRQYDATVTDLRKGWKPGIEQNALPENDALYYQLFSERNGFYPCLSLLDLLFSEGPAAKQVLVQHKTIIETWHK